MIDRGILFGGGGGGGRCIMHVWMKGGILGCVTIHKIMYHVMTE